MSLNKSLSALALVLCMALASYAGHQDKNVDTVQNTGVFNEPNVMLARVNYTD